MPYKNKVDQYAAAKRYNETEKGRAAQHRANMKPEAKARRRAFFKTEAGKEAQHKSYLKLRIRVIQHYGGKCACCGMKPLKFLAIDHINGGGNKHRKKLGGAYNFYLWLVRENFPKGFQVLCHNCNMATRYGATCPHKLTAVK